MYVFKGKPTFSVTPCPGGMALVDGLCPDFSCENDGQCLNGGTCNADKKCDCASGFNGMDCDIPGKIIQHWFFF